MVSISLRIVLLIVDVNKVNLLLIFLFRFAEIVLKHCIFFNLVTFNGITTL